MQNQSQGQQQTGTRNETYDVIAILYHALQGAENCQTYLNDAQNGEIRDFIQQALQSQRQLDPINRQTRPGRCAGALPLRQIHASGGFAHAERVLGRDRDRLKAGCRQLAV